MDHRGVAKEAKLMREKECADCLLSAPCCTLEEEQCPAAFQVCTSTDCDVDFFSTFCCEDESHLADLAPCDGGPTCPSASFVGWDDDCEKCLETKDKTGAETSEVGAGAGANCMTCWPEGMNVDDETLGKILDQCCCGTEFATPPTQTELPFPCRWATCNLSFADKELLALHVNADHLCLSPDLITATPSTSTSIITDPLQCLWDHCESDLPPLPGHVQLADPVQADVVASSLLEHLVLEHLARLEPDASNPPIASTSSAIPPHAHADHHIYSSSHVHTHDHIVEHAHPHGHEHSLGLSHPHIHEHSLAHSHVHPHSHQHSHPPHDHLVEQPSSVGPHRPSTSHSHLHPYSSRPSSSLLATSSTPPSESKNIHICRWQDCGLAFEKSSDLMNHLSEDHVPKRQSKYVCHWAGCERCGDEERTFPQRQKILRHLMAHTGDRPFVCEVCGKSFSEVTTLTQHVRIHTNERPYKCTFEGCEKAFAIASALTNHLRTHTGARPFKCSFPGCDAAFGESSNLSKHFKTHQGQKNHLCEECGKTFLRSDQLARHRRIVHAKPTAVE